MNNTSYSARGYALAIVLGAIGGGLIVAVATKAMPKMMSGMMRNMMQNKMRQMGKNGFNPGET